MCGRLHSIAEHCNNVTAGNIAHLQLGALLPGLVASNGAKSTSTLPIGATAAPLLAPACPLPCTTSPCAWPPAADGLLGCCLCTVMARGKARSATASLASATAQEWLVCFQ